MHQLGNAQPNISWLNAVLLLAGGVAAFQLVLFAATRLKDGLVKADDLLWIEGVLSRIRLSSIIVSVTALALAADGLSAEWFGSSEISQANVSRVMCSKTSSGAIKTTTAVPILDGHLCFRPLIQSAAFGSHDWRVSEQLITGPVALGQSAILTVRFFPTLFGGPFGYVEIVNLKLLSS